MSTNTPEDLLAASQVMQANLPKYKDAVGATTADITEVNEDTANLENVLEYTEIVEADKKTVYKIKQSLFNGSADEPVAEFPVFPVAAPPFALKAGCLERYNDRKRCFKAAKGYTKAIGIALGIESDTLKPAPDSLQAAAKVRDLGGYQFEAEFKKQGMSGMLFQDRVKGTEKWRDAKTALTSPVVIDVDVPSIEGAAVQIEIRCRLLKGNTPVGEWSPIYPLTVNS